ncbi:HWE histidine kinase domain-containing protein [Aurantimonas sp. Leaf443]|uniref:sensor histidine kinase n=1 Tax=Aurantimonas sp. Leaf443 TaxID=1736378 RepID=UPI000A51D0A4|nr:HWE histidine kinase domain-containing protein [Aurantimonas sp. Leaf443]
MTRDKARFAPRLRAGSDGPPDGGEVGRLIRAADFSSTPLGAAGDWPSPLRTILSAVLDSPACGSVLWGPDLRLFYNDAAIPFMEERHPAALGEPAPLVWGESWAAFAPLVAEVLRSGRGGTMSDLCVPLQRGADTVRTLWDVTCVPVRGEDGAVAGVFTQGIETTGRRLAETRQALRLSLADRLRACGDEAELMDIAAEGLGRHFGACRVGFGEVSDDGASISFPACYADGVAPITGTVPILSFGGANIAQQRAGRTLVLEDAALDGENAATWAGLDIGAVLSVPLVRDGVFRASLYINHRVPTPWNAPDIALVEEIASRAIDNLWRIRAEAETERARRRLEIGFDRVEASMEGLRQADRRQRLLKRELSHRMKNTLSMVQAVVAQSLRHAADMDEAAAMASARIQALARAQDILTATDWSASPVAEVVAAAIAPYRDVDERFAVCGPKVDLGASQALGLSLAIHELATNATKYGALSTASGRVALSWTHAPDGDFAFSWRESGGPPVRAPSRRGFGSRLVERVVPDYFDGRARIDYAPAGLSYELAGSLPTERRDGP